MGSNKIWNGRLAGVPAAAILTIGIVVRRLVDRANTLLWRGNLGELGLGARVQSGVTIRFPGNIRIGARASIANGCELTTEIDGAICTIGSDVIVATDVRLDFSGDLAIGDNVVISERTAVFTHSHQLDPKSSPLKTPLKIESDVWIGSGVTIIEGVGSVGQGSVIASGTVLTKSVPPYSLVAGVPGRILRSLR